MQSLPRIFCAVVALSPFLGAQVGTVTIDRKVGNGVGGFGGSLASLDTFGRSVCALGDLNGDGVADLAIGAPRDLDSSGTRPGRLFVAFLNRAGAVASEQEIAPGVGGFVGPLGSTDQFGWSLARLGDLDGDGVTELAVGANGDDTGGNNRGAVWILFLDTDGTVKDEHRIDSSNLGATLANNDEFGSALAALGDLDGNGVEDVAVGARFDNTGASDAGALWILFLNADGTVAGRQKIANGTGGFGGTLVGTDAFGTSVAFLGDLDGDGSKELAVGAVGDDTLASNGGAVWHLELSSSGTVLGQQEISTGLSGVAADDALGASVAVLGDLGGDGITELAVGAHRADDGGTNRGALRILTLTSSGSVSSAVKISSTSGGFGGPLNGGLFGASVAALGDLDLDGRADIAVGEASAFAPPSGTGTGAVWVISLVASADSVWTGAVDADWFGAGNWTNGVPDATHSAVVRASVTSPSIGLNAADAACFDLLLGKGAFLSLPEASEDLVVHRGVQHTGTLSGDGELQLVGTGSVLATSSFNLPVAVNTSGSLDFIGSGTAFNDEFALVDGTIVLADGHAAVLSGTSSTFLGGVVQGAAGTLDLDGPAVFSGCDFSAPPTLLVSNDLTLDASFAPASGMTVIDGAPGQVVANSGPSSFFDLHVVETADVQFQSDLLVGHDFDLQGTMEVDGAMDVSGDSVVDGVGDVLLSTHFSGNMVGTKTGSTFSTGGECFLGGDVVHYPGQYGSGISQFVFNNPGSVVVDVPQGFTALVRIQVGEVITFLNPAVTIGGGLVIESGTVEFADDASLSVAGAGGIEIQGAGTLDVTTHTLAVPGGPALVVNGTLRVGGGGELALDGSAVSVAGGGSLQLLGSPGQIARMTAGAGGAYALTVGAGVTPADLEARHFLFEGMNAAGVRIESSATLTAFEHGTFDRLAGGAPAGVLLDIARSTGTDLDFLSFRNTGGSVLFNVHAGAQRVSLHNWDGPFGGPDFEDDTADDKVFWGARLAYFTVDEGLGQNTGYWRALEETGDIVQYVLERRDAAPLSPFGLVGATPALGAGGGSGARSYHITDGNIVQGTAYVYRLREDLGPTGGVHDLAHFAVDGVRGPGALPGSSTPAPLALQGTGGSVHGGGGRRPAPTGDTLVALDPGVHPAFTIDARGARSVRVVATGPGTVIDAHAQPLTIRNLAAGQSVELVGLIVDASGSAHPALEIEASEGVVLGRDLELVAGEVESLRASDARTVVLQSVRSRGAHGLRLCSESLVSASDVSAALITLEGGSRLESWDLDGPVRAESGSTWVADDGRVRLRWEGTSGEIAAPTGTTWLLLGSDRPGGLRPRWLGQTLLLDPAGIAGVVGPRQVEATGSQRFELRDPRPALLQALFRLPGEHGWRATPLCVMR